MTFTTPGSSILALMTVLASSLVGCAKPPTTTLASLKRLAPAAAPGPATALGPGAVLQGLDEQGRQVTLRIDAVELDPADADGDVHLYQLSVRDGAGAWQRYCRPDRAGKTQAIPLRGAWNASRTRVSLDGAVTFACTSGALAKCVRWGYKPWKTVKGVSLADYHQACMYLTAADYCGDGTAHTREGTRIDLWDRLGIQKRETEAGQVFEAAWAPRGATYLNKPRYGETLESIVAECPARLRGRTRVDAPGLDEQAILARWPETLIFTESFVRRDLP